MGTLILETAICQLQVEMRLKQMHPLTRWSADASDGKRIILGVSQTWGALDTRYTYIYIGLHRIIFIGSVDNSFELQERTL